MGIEAIDELCCGWVVLQVVPGMDEAYGSIIMGMHQIDSSSISANPQLALIVFYNGIDIFVAEAIAVGRLMGEVA